MLLRPGSLSTAILSRKRLALDPLYVSMAVDNSEGELLKLKEAVEEDLEAAPSLNISVECRSCPNEYPCEV